MKKMKTMEELVAFCRGLRSTAEGHDTAFWLGLIEIEEKYMGMLRKNGCDSFLQFIRSYTLCEVARWNAFKSGLKYITKARAKKIGAAAVMELRHVHDLNKVHVYERAVLDWMIENGGVHPSRQAAHRLLRKVDPRPEVPKASATVSMVQKLKAENAELRRQLKAAKARIRELEAELAKRTG